MVGGPHVNLCELRKRQNLLRQARPAGRLPWPSHSRLETGVSKSRSGLWLEFIRHGPFTRDLSLGVFLLGCALMIVSGLRSADA